MAELTINIETSNPDGVPVALQERVRHQINLRPRVEVAERGSLPRYELKARRFRISRYSIVFRALRRSCFLRRGRWRINYSHCRHAFMESRHEPPDAPPPCR